MTKFILKKAANYTLPPPSQKKKKTMQKESRQQISFFPGRRSELLFKQKEQWTAVIQNWCMFGFVRKNRSSEKFLKFHILFTAANVVLRKNGTEKLIKKRNQKKKSGIRYAKYNKIHLVMLVYSCKKKKFIINLCLSCASNHLSTREQKKVLSGKYYVSKTIMTSFF